MGPAVGSGSEGTSCRREQFITAPRERGGLPLAWPPLGSLACPALRRMELIFGAPSTSHFSPPVLLGL